MKFVRALLVIAALVGAWLLLKPESSASVRSAGPAPTQVVTGMADPPR